MLISRRRRSSAAAQGFVVLAEGRVAAEATFTRAQASSVATADGFVPPVVVVGAGIIAAAATFTRAQSGVVATGEV